MNQIESVLRAHDKFELLWGEIDAKNEVFARNAMGDTASNGDGGQRARKTGPEPERDGGAG